MATTFQRARSDEQRAIRRQTILDTAAAMLEEMPVAELSLNELSRRVGLAKSNVLRYFDSREAVLLELLDSLSREWLEHLSRELPSAVSARAGFERRAERLAGAVARSLSDRPVLCDLLGAQAAVLEHNVSSDAIASFKRRGMAHAAAFGDLIRQALPELSEDQTWRLVIGVFLLTSSLWAHATPPQAVVDAYEQIPELDSMRLEFSSALEDLLATMAIGLHARSRRR
ncbi:MAG TPA: TetR family transcriptional regulator [Solirubrobacteraceae bacterium]|nr:TetR family transcriptional regulator [Solirubrobacteraceae bacterium]